VGLSWRRRTLRDERTRVPLFAVFTRRVFDDVERAAPAWRHCDGVGCDVRGLDRPRPDGFTSRRGVEWPHDRGMAPRSGRPQKEPPRHYGRQWRHVRSLGFLSDINYAVYTFESQSDGEGGTRPCRSYRPMWSNSSV